MFPSDELILGFQGTAPVDLGTIHRNAFKIKTGKYKIELFGSYLQNTLPKKQVRNQSLGFGNNIYSVHNDVKNDHDQFEINTISEFTGSMVDEVYADVSATTTLSFDTFTLANAGVEGLSSAHLASMNRGRNGSVSAGTAGVFGSVTRNIRIDSDSEYEEHSLYLDIDDLWEQAGAVSAIISDILFYYVGDSGGIAAGAVSHATWIYDFIFDSYTPKVSNQPFNADQKPKYIIYMQDGTLSRDTNVFAKGNGTDLYLFPSAQIASHFGPVDLFGTDGIAQVQNNLRPSDSYRIFVSIGSRSRGRYQTLNNANGSVWRTRDIRGFKYGLSNYYPSSDACVFRRTSYGQFRDMLEQRRFTTTYQKDGQTGLEIISKTIPVAIECRNLVDGTVLDLETEQDKIKRNNKNISQKSTKAFFDNEPIYNDPNAIRDDDFVIVS